MELKELKTNILELPKVINLKELDIMNLTEKYEELLLKQKLRINEVMLLVEEVLDENGKKLFSNELKRKTECDLRLRLDDDYQDLDKDISKLNHQLQLAKIELDFLGRQFRSYEAISRIGW